MKQSCRLAIGSAFALWTAACAAPAPPPPSAAAAPASSPPQHYAVLRKIPVGGEGGWDYLTLDAASRRLYVSRGTRVIVLDADSGAPVGEIAGTQGVHGIAI